MRRRKERSRRGRRRQEHARDRVRRKSNQSRSAHRHRRLRRARVGPLRIRSDEADADERVTFKAFDNWVGGKPKIQNVVIRIIPDATTRVLELRRGTVNFEINNIPLDQVAQFQNDSNFKVQTSHGGAYQYICFNLKDPILSKKEVRQALAYAIDRGRIVRDLLHGYGQVTDTIFPPGHWARAEKVPTYMYDP